MNLPKVGRNDPCHCGSGKKYKNCHMNQDESSKKTYTPDGKRKFKAKVLSISEKSTDIFQRTPPAAALPTNIQPGDGLKFKITSKDYRAKENEAVSDETPFVLPTISQEPTEQPASAAEFKPGDEFKPAQHDFREDSEKKQ